MEIKSRPAQTNVDTQARITNLYAAYGPKIYNLAYRMTSNAEDAADITQETFLQVFRSIADFRGDSSLYTWIYAIAKNLCHQHYRRKQKGAFLSFEALIREASGAAVETKITDLEKQNLIEQVKEGCLTGLLGCLSFYQRMAFILYILLDLSIKDVSIILGKSEGASKVLVHRARTNLKRFMCRHCSLYDAGNPCRCEDLIGFSLKHGWISLDKGNGRIPAAVAAGQIEREIRKMRQVVEIYESLEPIEQTEELSGRIRSLIDKQDWAIFSDKKV